MLGLEGMKPLKSGELAKTAGVNLETIRFYERQKLLPNPPRQSWRGLTFSRL